MDEIYEKKIGEGLSKFLVFLREEEEREKLEEIERLKPIGINVIMINIFYLKINSKLERIIY